MIFIPIIYVEVDQPYVNEWQTKVFVDVDAWMENQYYSTAWNYLDPYPTTLELNPSFRYDVPSGWSVDFVNFYTIEDGAYHWFTGVGEDGQCFGDLCFAQGKDWFTIDSDLDIDVIWVKLNEECTTCFPSEGPK